MTERIERQQLLDATPEEVWEAITSDSWLAEDVQIDLRPGGDAVFGSPQEDKRGWVEEAHPPQRLAFWWASGDEPATRVELTLTETAEGTLLRVVESRPLELLDLVGIPLPGPGGARYGPALVAA